MMQASQAIMGWSASMLARTFPDTKQLLKLIQGFIRPSAEATLILELISSDQIVCKRKCGFVFKCLKSHAFLRLQNACQE